LFINSSSSERIEHHATTPTAGSARLRGAGHFRVSTAHAAPITLPSGLNPGDTYFLAFVTDGTHNATSTNIADYDAVVTAQANLDADLPALGTTWKVIGSTATVSAATHLGLITSPIYNLAGQLVATGSSDLFDGTLNNPIDANQFGNQLTAWQVWTGTLPDGSTSTNHALGQTIPEHGLSDFIDMEWIAYGYFLNGTYDGNYYAISAPLVVPVAAVPEPGTISLMMGPALLLLGRYRPRRRRPATRTPPTDPAVH
jgi:hypothetical protein